LKSAQSHSSDEDVDECLCSLLLFSKCLNSKSSGVDEKGKEKERSFNRGALTVGLFLLYSGMTEWVCMMIQFESLRSLSRFLLSGENRFAGDGVRCTAASTGSSR